MKTKKSKQEITFEMSSKGQHEKALSASKKYQKKGRCIIVYQITSAKEKQKMAFA